MKNRIATIIACSFIAISLSGCYGSHRVMGEVTVVGPSPTTYAIYDLPPRPYAGEVAGGHLSNRFND